MPVLKDAVVWLTGLLQLFNPRLRDNSLSETFDMINEKTAASLTNLQENKAQAEALIEKLSEMGDYWTLSEEDQQKYDSLVEHLKELYPELNDVIDKNSKAIGDNKDAILANIAAWTKLQQQRLLDENIAEKQAEVAKKYADALTKDTEADAKLTEAEGKKVTAIDQVNAILKKNEDLRNAVYGAYGVTELNDENAADILNFIHEQGFETVGMDAVDEFIKLKDEAQALREEAKKMEEDADESQKDMTKFAEALARKLNVSLADTRKVKEEIQALKEELNSMPPGVRVSLDMPKAQKKAIGDAYIPYDNFPALLHRGEKVITATQARQEQKGVDLSGLEDKIIAAIKEGMKDAEVNSYLDGQAITDKVSKNLANQLADRRYV